MEEVKETSKGEGHSKRGGGRIVAFVERVREGVGVTMMKGYRRHGKKTKQQTGKWKNYGVCVEGEVGQKGRGLRKERNGEGRRDVEERGDLWRLRRG